MSSTTPAAGSSSQLAMQVLGEPTEVEIEELPELGAERPPFVVRVVDKIGDFWTLAVLGLLVAIFGAIAPTLFTQAAWLNISQYAVEYLLLAIGQTFVIITGGIDLSCGAVLAFSGMVAGVVMQNLLNSHTDGLLTTVVGFATALAIGAAIGFVNGFLIAKVRLPPFIVTFGSLFVFGYGATLINGGNEVYPLPSQISTIGSTLVLGGWIYVTVLVAAVAAVVFGLTLHRTRFGLRTFAIGSNSLAARRVGVRVDRHLVLVYALSGFLAGLAGMMVMSNQGVANPLAGQNDELYAIAAVVIGGTSLFGGHGTMLGSVVGTLIQSLLVTGLILVGAQGNWQQVLTGVIVVFAVAVDQLRLRLLERY